MDVKLKICGMRDAVIIQRVGELRPDYMGFIFYPKSPRFVGDYFELPSAFPADILRVGVFVNESVEVILNKVQNRLLDFVQLHGDESVEMCDTLRQQGARVIKVFSVDEHFDFKITEAYQPVADYFLFDTKGKYYGGNAKKFDWQILGRYNQKVPFFLSGGISADDIADVGKLKQMNLHALDINSGVEVKPGTKDLDKIKQLQVNLLNSKF